MEYTPQRPDHCGFDRGKSMVLLAGRPLPFGLDSAPVGVYCPLTPCYELARI